MLGTRLFLGFSALVWLPYGVYCAIQPSFLAAAAGVVASSPTALTEIRAMYGGLEAGIGALCACALFRPALSRPALLMLCFVCGGLGLTRLGAMGIDASGTAYTFGALALEIPSTLIAGVLVRRSHASER